MKLLFLLFLIGICQSKKGFGPGEQDWDFAEVRPGANMFWWLYYTSANVQQPETKPLVIWLQGGPGGSSTGYGNFMELGPLDSDLQPRNTTWVKYYNVLFIDNPVGTGFSYVDSSGKLTTDNKQVASDLVECMRLFYKRLAQFESTPLYITAESYGGKMAVEFALELNKAVEQGKLKANLKGVGIVDSWIHPMYSVSTWAPYLLDMGIVDTDGYKLIDDSAQYCQGLYDAGKYEDATDCFFDTEGVVYEAAISIDFYNVLTKEYSFSRKIKNKADKFKGLYSQMMSENDLNDIMNRQVREALNISKDIRWDESNGAVFDALSGDFMKPVTDVVESLLNTTNVKVFVISGQLDLIVDTPGTYKWVSELKFKNKASWDAARRRALSANGYLEGYVKSIENFAFCWVDRSGHMVPADNPAAMLKILQLLTSN